MAAPSQTRERICVARIGAAHGVRGEVKFWSFTADPAAVAGYGPFETADGRLVELETLRPAKEFFVARLKGVGDRDAAERLRNVELFVPRERLPDTADTDEFYHADLIGLAGGGARHRDAALHPKRGAAGRHRGRTHRGRAARGRFRCRRRRPRGTLTAMWRASVLTIFPDMFPGPLGASLAGKAREKGIWSLDPVDLRDYATDKHRTVDDTPAGGGPGMVMKPDVIARAIDAVAADARPRLLMSPRGTPLTQARVAALAQGP